MDEQEHCLMHVPSCVRVNGVWERLKSSDTSDDPIVPPPASVDVTSKAPTVIFDAHGVPWRRRIGY